MIRRAVAALALALAVPAAAQWPGEPPPPSPLPSVQTTGMTAEAFVPAGWAIEQRTDGDIDGRDGRDVVMVIKNRDRANFVSVDGFPEPYDSNPRMLVVLLAAAGGGFRLGEANGTLIPRLANVNQEDLFDALTLKKRVIGVAMHEAFDAGGYEMGSKSFRLRWQGGRLVVIGYDKDTTVHNTGATKAISANYLTGRMLVTAGSMDDVRTPTRTVRLPRQPLMTLADVGDGLMFDPERP